MSSSKNKRLAICKSYINTLNIDKYYSIEQIPTSIIAEFIHITKRNLKLKNRIIKINYNTGVFKVLKKKLPISKYKGVYWDRKSMKWMVRLHINLSNKFIGLYRNEHIASVAYQVALAKYDYNKNNL